MLVSAAVRVFGFRLNASFHSAVYSHDLSVVLLRYFYLEYVGSGNLGKTLSVRLFKEIHIPNLLSDHTFLLYTGQ